MLNAQLYIQSLEHLHKSLVEKPPALVNRKNIPHDDRRPYTAGKNKGKIALTKLVRSALIRHIPTDYYLFRSTQNTLLAKTLSNESQKVFTVIFFVLKPAGF